MLIWFWYGKYIFENLNLHTPSNSDLEWVHNKQQSACFRSIFDICIVQSHYLASEDLGKIMQIIFSARHVFISKQVKTCKLSIVLLVCSPLYFKPDRSFLEKIELNNSNAQTITK